MISDSKKRMIMADVQLDHNRLLSLINNMSEAFVAVNDHGMIEINNGVALDVLDTNSLIGKQFSAAMPVINGKGTAQNLLELAKDKRYLSRDMKLKYSDGRIINLAVNVSPVRAGFGSKQRGGYAVVFSDITDEKMAEEERDDFISVASHELRNPVTVAEGSLSNAIFMSQKSGLPDNLMEMLKSAHEQLVFLATMINDLATISRANRQKFADLAADFDVKEVLESVQRDYTDQAAKKGLKLELKADQLPKLFGSRLYVHEVMQNFVTNAIKYTQTGSVTILAVPTDKGLDLSVEDTGFGIDPAEQAKLFSKFYRSEDSRVRSINGTGLGLYVSAKLAKLMGGSISMKSQLNHGSTFTLHLPKTSKPAQGVA